MNRIRRKPKGRIPKDELLTTDGCMEWAGLGHESLSQARKSGMVTPIEIAGRRYYETNELMAWIRATGKRVVK